MAKVKDKILLVDGDENFLAQTSEILKKAGYNAITANSGALAMEIVASHCPDVIFVESSLGKTDVAAFIAGVKAWSNRTVIVLSECAAESVKVRLLDAGADDYLVKPVGQAEFLARVRCALRKSSEVRMERVANVGGVQLDYLRHKVTVCGVPAKLTPTEYRIVAALFRRSGEVVGYGELAHELWGPSAPPDNRILRVHVAGIRKKLPCGAGKLLKTESGVGYSFSE